MSFTYTKSVCQLYAVSHFKRRNSMKNSHWDIFGEVKETVSVPSAAEYYGMSVRGGMTTCIFHEDRNPSMKLYDDHFYCFGCTEYGDVVKLTASSVRGRLFSQTAIRTLFTTRRTAGTGDLLFLTQSLFPLTESLTAIFRKSLSQSLTEFSSGHLKV